MFGSVFARSKTSFLTTPLTKDVDWAGSVTTRRELESRLARKGLMIGLSIQRDTVSMHLVGKLTAASSLTFKELMKTFVGNGHTSFVFDLSGLENLDSSGVAALIWARNLMLENSGRLSVTNPSRAICHKLLAINFHHVVEIESISYMVSAN
jgi:anti-anti-sigma factor